MKTCIKHIFHELKKNDFKGFMTYKHGPLFKAKLGRLVLVSPYSQYIIISSIYKTH